MLAKAMPNRESDRLGSDTCLVKVIGSRLTCDGLTENFYKNK